MSSHEVQVWVNYDTKHCVIVFTGTHSASDWLNNAKMGVGLYQTTERFKYAKAVFEEAVEKFKNYKITLVGHSQAGMIVHLLDDPRVHEVLSYNPAWFPTTKQHSNEYIVKAKGDPVSIAVRANPKNTIFNTYSFNPLYNHSTDALDRLPPEKLIGKGLAPHLHPRMMTRKQLIKFIKKHKLNV
jgi:hypothetical protein